MTPTPLSVIGGYLGAGKTTLINQLLAAPHGRRLAVLVNDFGAINIDAALLKSAGEDTIELTNGCICCTGAGDLFFAVGDLLDRSPRPDHIVIEASGIADPAKIAAVAVAEKDLRYSGIITVVDGLNIDSQIADPRIGRQVSDQMACADLLALSKLPADSVEPLRRSKAFGPMVHCSDLETIMATLFGDTFRHPQHSGQGHPAYIQWTDRNPTPLEKQDIVRRLSAPPEGLLRLKSVVGKPGGGFWEIHLVGSHWDIRERDACTLTGTVAIGLKTALDPARIHDWWVGTL